MNDCRNFPTAANIAKKQKLAAERKERGEVASAPLYRYVQHLLSKEEGGEGEGGVAGKGRKKQRGKMKKQNHQVLNQSSSNQPNCEHIRIHVHLHVQGTKLIKYLNWSALLSCLYEFNWPLAYYFSESCLTFWLAIMEKCTGNGRWPAVISRAQNFFK